MSIYLFPTSQTWCLFLLFQDRKHHQQNQNFNKHEQSSFSTEYMMNYTVVACTHCTSGTTRRVAEEREPSLNNNAINPSVLLRNHQQQSTAKQVLQLWLKLNRSSPCHSSAATITLTREKKKEDSNIPAGLSQEKSQQNACTKLKSERTDQWKPLLFYIGKKPNIPENQLSLNTGQ